MRISGPCCLCESVALELLPAWLALVTIVITITATAVTTTTAAAATTVTTAATTAAIGPRLGFVNGQIAAAEILAVECLDSCCCLFRGCHFHKSKAA